MTRDLKARFLSRFPSPVVWDAIEQAYSEPQRHYHTLAHLHWMFAQYYAVQAQLHAPVAVELAIWFHDFAYATDAAEYAQNEIRSVETMRTLVGQHLPDVTPKDLDSAAEMILATQKHAIQSTFLLDCIEARSDCEYFLDMDLSILGGTERDARGFDAKIRQEFAQYSDAAFARGRVAVLTMFLNRSKIFLSPPFQEREAAARSNLALLINFWSK